MWGDWFIPSNVQGMVMCLGTTPDNAQEPKCGAIDKALANQCKANNLPIV